MKAQMKFQKFAMIFAFGSAILYFVYALGFCTDLSSLTNYVKGYRKVSGSSIYYDVQPYNHMALRLAIVSIILAVFMFILQNAKRRKYYITNYISSVIFSGFNVYAALYINKYAVQFKEQFLTTMDFEKWKKYDERNTYSTYFESTFWFDLGTVAAVIGIAAALIVIGNLIWKTVWMMKEKKAMELFGKEAVHEA